VTLATSGGSAGWDTGINVGKCSAGSDSNNDMEYSAVQAGILAVMGKCTVQAGYWQ
jgi:hypothetical protein